MSGIVLELQREALDKTVRVSDLLRKALLVARKLKTKDIESWIMSELNGYTQGTDIPDYRWVSGEIKSWNPYNGTWAPIMFSEASAEIHQTLTRRLCNQGAAEIESLTSKAHNGQLAMSYPPKAQAMLIRDGRLPSPPVLLVPEARFHGILDAIRTAILDWALKLEEEGVTGQNLSFTEADRKAASHIEFHIGTMSHSQIQADTVGSQQTLVESNLEPERVLEFVGKVRSSLAGLGLNEGARDELAGELTTLEAQAQSPKPKQAILRESLISVRTILEAAAGHTLAGGLLEALHILFP